jgi:DNA-binding SARP family transcriptional activator/tetratricopeptide (TPR) repeat protein
MVATIDQDGCGMTEETLQGAGRTRIQLCGRLVVELKGRRVEGELPSRQGRLLFAYLALNADRAVRREELIECIWPDRPPAEPSAALNTLVSRLRRALGAGVLEGIGELRLALPPNAEIDVKLAEEALARARAAVADRDWQAAWGPAHAALAIARRGLLPGLEAAWIDRSRRELEDLEFEALELVVETGLGLGGAELAAAERASSALVERAPFRESGYRLRMETLAARGNLAQALQTYEELRRVLGEELGTAPSPAVTELHMRLLRGEVADHDGRQRPPRQADGTGFVGRRRELAAFDRVLGQLGQGRRQLVLIAGDAGIGKTRLAQELTARARGSGAEGFWGRCYEGSGAPAFWPWMEVIRALARGKRPEQLRRALGPGGGNLTRLVPELAELFPDLEAPPPLAPEAARFALYDSLSGLLARLCASTPLVLVLDDLHWADPASLEALRFVASRPDDAPLLLVGTYRDTEVGAPLAQALADLARRPLVTRLELDGLAEDELATLVAHATGSAAAAPLVTALHHRTGGNPFFASELVRLLESGDTTADAVLRRELPGGVRDVIRHRLDGLPAESTSVLARAAVIGEEFDLELLAPVSELSADRALELVEVALRKRIAAERPSRTGGYRFSHALIRETLYAELSAVRRARLHCRVANVLEQQAPAGADRVIELAHHFFEGAAVDAGAAGKAHAYALLAAERAMSSLAYEQAELQLRRALELVDRTPPGPERSGRELEVQLQLGALLMMTQGYGSPEVGAACARATELCRELGDDSRLLSCMWRLGVFHEVRAEFQQSSETGEQLIELGRGNRRADFTLAGSQLVGVAAVQRGELEPARDSLAHALTLADSVGRTRSAELFGHDFRITARCFLGWTLTLLGDDVKGRTLLTEGLALARHHSHAFDQAFALALNATAAFISHDPTSARAHADQGVALSADQGFPMFAAMTGMVRGWASGDPSAVEASLTAMEATGARMMLHFHLGLLGEAHRDAGQPDEALAAVERGLAVLDTNGRFYEAELHRLQGELVFAMNPKRADEARTALRTAVAVAQKQRAKLLELRARASLAHLPGN